LLEKRKAVPKGKSASIFDLKFINQTYVWSVSKDRTICIWHPQLKKITPFKKMTGAFFTTITQVDTDVWMGSIEGGIL
jgi:hypothetical protein